MAKLNMHLFGSPRMDVDGRPVVVDTRKATALMAFLAVSREPHQRDTLATLLWPDYDQSSARAALRRTLSTLNRALGSGTLPDSGTEKGFLEIARETIGAAPRAEIWLDVAEFRQQLASLGGHGHASQEVCPACLEALEKAAGLYHEPFMAGFSLRDSPNFEEWQFFQEETLRRELAGALEKLVRGLEAAGRGEEAIQYARRWLALDSLQEEAHRQLMHLYMHAGQRNAALRQFQACVRILDQELGVAPLEETTRLYQAILNREPLPELETRLRFVDSPTAGSAQPAADKSQPAADSTQPAADKPQPASIARPAPTEPAIPAAEPALRPLVGRGQELARLLAVYQDASAGGRMASLEGEAGIGKTRLAEAFLEQLRAGRSNGGARVIQARCYPGETGLAYAPLIEGLTPALPDAAARLGGLPPAVLGEAARLLPELSSLAGGAPLQSPGGEGAQARFFEALRQVIQALLVSETPDSPAGVLFLDDLHWADSATLNLLAYLARRLAGMPVLLLCAWRSEQSETVRSLERLAADLGREERALRIKLERLGPAEVSALVHAAAGQPWPEPEALAQRLYQESEGLPFVAVEYLSAFRSPGKNASWEMPASVRDLLRTRLAGVDSAAQQLLGTAAVIGRSFDFNTLREASGRSDLETVDGLDRLLAAGLVVEIGALKPIRRLPGVPAVRDETGNPAATAAVPPLEMAQQQVVYDFTHEKLRELIYEETSLARRRLLHRRTAEALARGRESGRDARGENAGLVAYHYQQAGLDDQAAEYHRLAGERAQRLFANVEAMAHFQAALAAGHPDAAGLHEAIGDLHTLRGEYGAAITSYQTAAALCTPGCLANLEHKLGSVHQRRGEWELAESHYQASLEAAGEPEEKPSPFHVQLFADRALIAHARGDLQQAVQLASRALELAQSCADAHALAQAYNALGVLARARGDLPAAVSALENSLRAAERLDDPLARIAALNNLALVYGEAGSSEQAIQVARQALELCQRRGDRHREAALHNNLADLLHRSGREEESMQQLKKAVVIFAEIGAPAQDIALAKAAPAEIWKLTEW